MTRPKHTASTPAPKSTSQGPSSTRPAWLPQNAPDTSSPPRPRAQQTVPFELGIDRALLDTLCGWLSHQQLPPLNTLRILWTLLVPKELAPFCRAARIDRDCLRIDASAAAFAQELQLYGPTLLNRLASLRERTRLPHISRIHVDIRNAMPTPALPPVLPPTAAPAAIPEPVQASLAKCPDDELRTQLERLIRASHSQRQN